MKNYLKILKKNAEKFLTFFALLRQKERSKIENFFKLKIT